MQKDFLGLSFLVCFSIFSGPAGAATIEVMTQNQYLGADLAPILAAPDAGALNAALVTALQTVVANKPEERMKALADDIAKNQPALVGLQEVYRFDCVDIVQPPPLAAGCSDPSIAAAFSDHLQATLDALKGAYVEAASVINLNIPGDLGIPGIPFVINEVPALLSVVDRDVILARKSVEATPVNYPCAKPSEDGCNYSVVLQAAIPVDSTTINVSVERGFVAVDAAIDGKEYRLVNTHLEQQLPVPTLPELQAVQSLQAAELLQILLTTPGEGSLIVVGDINSSPEHQPLPGFPTPYQRFVAASFTDIWELRPGNQSVYTCCQDEDLSNRKSELYERIDMIFSWDVPTKVKKVRLVNDKVSDKTHPPGRGLWPSDHAGVTAELQFQLLTAQN
jgi:endonuclease/exonuclease/phosphatase family metal-dependent hydrolase